MESIQMNYAEMLKNIKAMKREENKKKFAEKKKAFLKGIVKKTGRFLIKTAKGILAVTACCSGLYGVMKFGAYTAAADRNLLDFSERTYDDNLNIEAGYYNEHPISICISDEFSDYNTKRIIDGLKTIDKESVGMKFDISVGTPSRKIHDVCIYSDECADNVLGCATMNDTDSKHICGNMYLDENKFNFYGMKSLLMHEMGHILGLEHSKDLNSLMYPVVSRYTLSEDFIEHVNAMYPAKESSTNKNYNHVANSYKKIIDDEMEN